EESVANMKANADALNRDIATIHSNIVQEYNTLKGYSWKWLGGVSVAFLVMFCVLGWGMKTMLLKFIFFRAKMPFHTLALQDDLQTLLSPGTDPLFWSLICPGSFY
ncbi:hypothetical protein AB7M44_25565, partial [Escherichia coli]